MDILRLKSFLSSDPNAKALMDEMKGSYADERFIDHVSVEAAIDILSSNDLSASRIEVVEMFQYFGICGGGRFITGRRGKPSRFQWMHNLKAFRKALTEEGNEPDNLSSNTPKALEKTVEKVGLHHQFHLRPNYTVKFELPTNLSGNEASRLAKFIESLPMA